MRAAVLENYGELRLREVPEPQGGGVLLTVLACGVCGSDLSVYKGTSAMRARWKPPLILGHEIAAMVSEGPEEWQGRYVAVNPIIPCGDCSWCRGGRPNLCPHRRHIGFHVPGGFAERIRVPLSQLHPLPDGLPPWKGALAEPLAVAVRAVELAGPILGRRVLVLGGGGIGSLVAWVLSRTGARVTIEEKNPARRAWLQGLGWEVSNDHDEGTFEVVFDTVGSQATLKAAVQACLPGGMVVLVGLTDMEVPLPLQHAVLGEKQLRGSYTFTTNDFARAMTLLPEVPEALVLVRPFAEVEEILSDLLSGNVAAAKLILKHEA